MPAFCANHLASNALVPARLSILLAVGAVTLLLNVPHAVAAEKQAPESESFGTTEDGKNVRLWTLNSEAGVIAKVTDYGATLVELHVPNSQGKTADVVLGFDNVSGYQSEGNQYFGCTTGRVANRIDEGKFTLNGKTYELAINDEPNHLHGGTDRSLDKVVWEAKPVVTKRGQGVRFTYTSPDGEEGYPGTLETTVTYLLTENGALRITYKATTDQPTPVNLTNHAYFNLSGHGSDSVLDHVLFIDADKYTPTDDTLIPTGEIQPVAGTPLDFTKPRKLRARIDKLVDTASLGYDHNYVLNGESGELRTVARVKDPQSGRVMVVRTTEPGLQLYSGNFLKGQTGKDGKTYPQRSALCLEAQHFPDAVNQPDFPSIILEPGETYEQTTVYAFPQRKPDDGQN